MRRGRGFSAHLAQRSKVQGARCLNCAQEPCDPAHVVSRARGGCNDPLCVIPLCRRCHDAYDGSRLDLLPLVRSFVPELVHAVGHVDGDLLGLLHRLTGVRWAPDLREAA